jgi:hypothetical protein
MHSSLNRAQALLCPAVTIERLSHIPFSARIKEGDIRALWNRLNRANLHVCDVHDRGRPTRVIHVDEIRVKLWDIRFGEMMGGTSKCWFCPN